MTTMTTVSKSKPNGRLITLWLAVIAVWGATLFFIVAYFVPLPQWEATTRKAPSPAPNVALAPPLAQPDKPNDNQPDNRAALATAQSEAAAALAAVAPPPAPPPAQPTGPAFDLARIEGTGDAVLAGSAVPGAAVELLRNGQPLEEHAVADASGQFVMVLRLPPGSYDLSLRSKAPDGTIALSTHGVPVAVNEAAAVAQMPTRADAAPSGQEAAASPPSEARTAAPASDAAQAQSAQPQLAAADTATGAIPGKPATRVVARGDSLWRMSRLAYGDGTRYTVIYRANRARIHDPNRIYPGQIFAVPPHSFILVPPQR